MEIKIDRLNKIADKGNLKAFVDISIDGIHLKGFKVVEHENELFISKPSQKGKDDKYHSTVWFDSRSFEDQVNKTILEEYLA